MFANATTRKGFRLSPKCSPVRYGLAFPRGTSLSRFRMIKDIHPQAGLGKEISSSEVHTGHTARAGDGRPFLSDGKVGWGGWTRTNTVLINSGNFDVQDVRNVQCVQQNALGGRKLLRAFSLANWTPEWTPHQFLRFSKSVRRGAPL